MGDDLHIGPGNSGGQPARQVEGNIGMSGEQAAAAGDTLSAAARSKLAARSKVQLADRVHARQNAPSSTDIKSEYAAALALLTCLKASTAQVR